MSLFLTLVGLLGTFYAVQLANWYRELLALQYKWKLNKDGEEAEVQPVRRECRYALRGLYNQVIFWVTLVLTAFLVFVCVLSAILVIDLYQKEQLARFLIWVLGAFLAIYLGLTAYFLFVGYRIGRSLDREINPPALGAPKTGAAPKST